MIRNLLTKPAKYHPTHATVCLTPSETLYVLIRTSGVVPGILGMA